MNKIKTSEPKPLWKIRCTLGEGTLWVGEHNSIYFVDIKKKKICSFNIKNKKNLGSDRIANAIGAKKFKNCLILDFGTATTFDVIKNGIYEGGVIAPGVNLSIKNLSQATALLPIINLKSNQKSYGKR